MNWITRKKRRREVVEKFYKWEGAGGGRGGVGDKLEKEEEGRGSGEI